MPRLFALIILALSFAAVSISSHADDGKPDSSAVKKKILFIAGKASHGYGSHDHYAGCMLLAKCLNESGLPVQCSVVKNGWPQDKSVFDGVDAVVMYSDGGGGHMVNAHLDELDELANQGIGIGAIHYAVETVKGKSGSYFLDWMGGYFEPHWSVNPHWTAEFKEFPKHAVTSGVKPFAINDEWYFHMRFREQMDRVTPVLSAVAPDSTMKRPDGPHSGNPAAREAVAKGKPQHVGWVAERPDGGRGFGFTGGHYHWNWGNDQFRKLVLNGIAWIAKVEVPAEGVPSKTPTVEELMANIDEPVPGNFDRAKIQAMLDGWNK